MIPEHDDNSMYTAERERERERGGGEGAIYAL